MRKQLLSLLLALSLFLLCPMGAFALNPEQETRLTLHYQKNGEKFSGLPIRLYRVAEFREDGSFELLEPFASDSINIHGITRQSQWQQVTQTLYSAITAHGLSPDYEGTTNGQGQVHFSDLEKGLYFVCETFAETAEGTHVFDPFVIYLPTPLEDGSFDYEVEAYPKCTQVIPKTQYTVTKLWQDAGSESGRPKEITVELYQDGILQSTQVLSAANNWTYTWSVSEADQGTWTVAERDVPKGYKVTVQKSGSTFSIINTGETKLDPPKTGDTFNLMPWIVTMGLSGVLLLMLALYGRRRRA